MTEIDLIRIKRLRYLGTYTLSAGSAGGALPDYIDVKGKTVSMYQDFELHPTTHYIIDETGCRMYMRYADISMSYTAWDKFKEKK